MTIVPYMGLAIFFLSRIDSDLIFPTFTKQYNTLATEDKTPISKINALFFLSILIMSAEHAEGRDANSF